jgi:thiol:disulfide interchange protein DsbA
MQRREFALGLSALAVAAAWPQIPAWAAGEAIEGKTYKRLANPQPVEEPGKIEVIEFFGYWCPHCNALEPALDAWARKLPPDVVFKRIPVSWQAMQEPYQKLYYALRALGLGPEINAKVFAAVHVQHLRLDTDAGLAAFASANGIDKSKLADAMRSFTVVTHSNMAKKAWAAYGLDSVPSLVVNGRYLVQAQGDGAGQATMEAVDAVIRKVRAKG